MSFPQNLHTHTTFGDGKNSPEVMVQGAIRAGCLSLGFSEHSPLPPDIDAEGWSMAYSDVAAYRREILRLRNAYAGKIDIFLGLEQDLDSPLPDEPYDYRIGSVHSVWADGFCLSVDASAEAFDQAVREHFGGDYFAFARSYFLREAEIVRLTQCQIVGHFDLLTKFNEGGCRFDESDPRYRNAALDTLHALLDQNVIFEINTGAMSRGYRSTPYPAPFLLNAIRQIGGRVCISSDSHSADSIVHAFPLAAEFAQNCGFQEVWVLGQDGFHCVDVNAYRGPL